MALAGKQLTPLEIARLAYKHGIPLGERLTVAVAVCNHESRFYLGAWNFNTKTGDKSYGLWQINMLGGMQAERRAAYGLKTNEDLYDGDTNARIMADLSSKGADWSPWGAYNSGVYKDSLPLARTAVKALTAELSHVAPPEPVASPNPAKEASPVSRYPGAAWLPIPENVTQTHIIPKQFILHSLSAPWTVERTRQYWQEQGVNLEAHFAVGYDGSVGQFLDTTVRADANASANNTAISVESASKVGSADPWTTAQVDSIVKLMVWAHKTHAIPARICRTATDPGFGIHNMFVSWSGGGTTCPGPARTKQFHDSVWPKFLSAISAQPAPQAAPASSADKPWVWSTVGPGQSNNSVKVVQQALIKLGFTIPAGATGNWPEGGQTTAAYAAFQKSLGLTGADADGTPGPWSLKQLAAKGGFTIKEAAPTVIAPAPARVASPVPGYKVTYAFGVKNSRYAAGYHTGDDYAAPVGTRVVAVRSGVITKSNALGGAYGNWVHLKADNGHTYVYCHLSVRSVVAGQKVQAGATIGKVGATGNVTGPHVHFEESRGATWAYGAVQKPTW